MFLSAKTQIMFIYIYNQIIFEVMAISLGLICLDLQRGQCMTVCVCVCVMTFQQRARARFINHKHEPMDPITLWRYVCLLSSVKSKERQEGETDTFMQAYPSSVDTSEIFASLPGHYFRFFNFVSTSSCLCNDE